MNFTSLKKLLIPDGEVKELLIKGVSVWRRPIPYKVEITNDNTSPITGIYLLQNTSITFSANYKVPEAQSEVTPTWTISGLPSGLSADTLKGDSLTVSGYPEASGDFTINVSVQKGDYSDAKAYTLTVIKSNYGVSITTSNASAITDFTLGNSKSKTFAASFVVPEEEQSSALTWSATGLPSGLSINSSTGIVSGTATATGSRTVTVTVTKGSYRNTKQFTFTVYGLRATKYNVPTGYKGITYYGQLAAYDVVLPSEIQNNYQAYPYIFSASNLPAGLSCNTSGEITGKPTTLGTKTVSIFVKRASYTSPASTVNLTIAYPSPPYFSSSSLNVKLSAEFCRKSSNKGNTIAFASVAGVNLDIGYAHFLGGAASIDRIISGTRTSATKPIVTIYADAISNTEKQFRFVLKDDSDSSVSSLIGRGVTQEIVYLSYTAENGTVLYAPTLTLNISFE